MLHVNFKAYSSYVTDSLYQWDINQKLNITGLELTTPPEIHFANANMERAIVREAVINNGTITVDIPNSILQAPLPIMAYIGVYEGETFKVIESIKIPVISKPQPTDYKFVDDGGDIYSYNAILNELSRFETEYGYEVLKNDVDTLKTRVTPIELGGTGATTVEGAIERLGIKEYQKPWNLDANVNDILLNAYRIYTSKNETSVDRIYMINSGTILLSFDANIGSTKYSDITVNISVGDTIVRTLNKDDFDYYSGGSSTTGKHHDIILNVKKGDVLTVEISSVSTETNSSYVSLNNIMLSANIETPYKYFSLSNTAGISIQDVMNTLLGVE